MLVFKRRDTRLKILHLQRRKALLKRRNTVLVTRHVLALALALIAAGLALAALRLDALSFGLFVGGPLPSQDRGPQRGRALSERLDLRRPRSPGRISTKRRPRLSGWGCRPCQL